MRSGIFGGCLSLLPLSRMTKAITRAKVKGPYTVGRGRYSRRRTTRSLPCDAIEADVQGLTAHGLFLIQVLQVAVMSQDNLPARLLVHPKKTSEATVQDIDSLPRFLPYRGRCR